LGASCFWYIILEVTVVVKKRKKKKQLLGRSEGNLVKLQLSGLVIIIFELDFQSVVESAVGGANQQWFFVGS
jgi:hypothetical protein